MSKMLASVANIDHVAEKAAMESVKAFSEVEALKDHPELVKGAILLFVKHLIGALVYTSLIENDSNDLTNQEKYTMTKQSYLLMKLNVQEIVAQGFEVAFTKFKGESLDFHCSIKPIVEPNSKAVH